MFTVQTSYPPDAIGGSDFFTGAAARRIPNPNLHGDRPELILVTDKEMLMEDVNDGRVCVSESTIRAMGHAIGMFDADQVQDLVDRASVAEAALERESLTNAKLARMNATLADELLPVTVYVDLAGREHTSREAVALAHPPAPMPVQMTTESSHVLGVPHGLVREPADHLAIAEALAREEEQDWRDAMRGALREQINEPVPASGRIGAAAEDDELPDVSGAARRDAHWPGETILVEHDASLDYEQATGEIGDVDAFFGGGVEAMKARVERNATQTTATREVRKGSWAPREAFRPDSTYTDPEDGTTITLTDDPNAGRVRHTPQLDAYGECQVCGEPAIHPLHERTGS